MVFQGFPLATKALPFLYCFSLWRGKVIIPGGLGARSMVQFVLAFILAFLVTLLCRPTVLFLVVLEWEACSHRIQSLGLPLLAKVLFLEVNLYAI